MGPIKIAYFIDRIIEGGTELQLVEQINRLEAKGIRQTLYCLYKSDEQNKIPINCNVEILNIRSLAKCDSLKKMVKVAKTLKSNKVDIVQTYFFDSIMFGVLCAKIAGVNKILSCRRDLGFWYTKRLILWLRIINTLTDRILVNSSAVQLNVAYHEKVRLTGIDIIRNGIDVKRYQFTKDYKKESRLKLSIQEDDICIGIIANMSREVKRLDLFVEAARIIISNGIHVKFFVLGDGYLRKKLEIIADQYNLKSNLFFLGKAYIKDRLLSCMDIGVITSDSEGLSNSLLEYMASGIPSVASNVGGNLELIRDKENGYLFNKGNSDDLALKLSGLINDAKKRKEYGEQAAKDILHFDWNAKMNEILNYYKFLLAY